MKFVRVSLKCPWLIEKDGLAHHIFLIRLAYIVPLYFHAQMAGIQLAWCKALFRSSKDQPLMDHMKIGLAFQVQHSRDFRMLSRAAL